MKLFAAMSSVLMSASLLFGATTAQADQLESVQQKGVLKVAVPQDFPPFGSVGTDLKPHGYDIDMAAYLAQKLDVKLELVPVTSANRIPYLQTGKVDLVISSMGKNAEREKVIDFSAAYAPFYLGVFGSSDETVTSAQDLSGKTIGVTRGSVEDLELSKIAPSDATIKRFEDNNATLSSFLSGQVSLIATGNLVVTEIATRYPAKAPQTKFLLKNSPCYVGVMKGEEALLKEVNRLITEAKQDGVLEGFSQKWLKAPFPADLGA
ncbi:transporter substrate-binding domain-containing protein [Vibrio fluvialis]|uniref:ABC glutamine transporter extracellular solute-binding protein, family 3 n=1 Tax=Vibrio fluvialis TaxID=676 RepID=A0AAX2LYN8_VIBFL|nr:transporter substrate-binding domain-containing protein [Vibrio fluvialis]TNF11387.1 MAG: transporter substrate-binding domain-containing protein [Vibrionaceae bacterium]AMF92553.1 amino acid ABC transporter substrate-binding protein [Vibrio fluvialis]EKO3441216.1 transporter substrate-binding domain-containing protein [Vibrio fluvialis]EKO3453295.1 transporter substrate-binding domain-containing protein [Vibrio fluvialis]EKO3460770.1 transporter substrate-binding domain-containing protein 